MSENPFKKKFSIVSKSNKELTPVGESSSQSFNAPSQSTESYPSPSTQPSDTPAPLKKAPTKLVFKNRGSVPATPSAPPQAAKPKKSKAGRPSKPSAKIIENRKRPSDDTISDPEGATIQVQQPAKKVKLNAGGPSKALKVDTVARGKPLKISIKSSGAKTPATPAPASAIAIKLKPKGKKPERPRGDGYDSEASDREDDPYIEEEFILRMAPGEDCDYINHCIKNRLIGVNKLTGGADIVMKFYEENGRRGAIQVRGNWYATTLVDLPCIVEGMKSWDKRGWWKSADICQMLWVFARVKDESEAKTIALPPIIDPSNYQFPHGLTAPMYNARKRRFRKRLHRDEIEKVEREVQRLLDEDQKATTSKYQIFDPNARNQSQSYSRDGSTPARYGQAQQYSEDEEDEDEEDENEDAEGEEDDGYFAQNHGQGGNTHLQDSFGQQQDNDADADADADGDIDFGDDFEREMEKALEEEAASEAGTPMSNMPPTPSLSNALLPETREDTADESVEDDDDDDDDDEDSEIDDEEKEKLAAIKGAKEDIAEMENKLQDALVNLASAQAPMMKKRLEASVRNLKQEIQLKKSAIGEGEGEE
ncbi:related to transcription initiation factor TFIID subunit [Rhynchosporium secalis]|uniref:Related to transcription initiation factor TFIID subunit n=1 Tax=Rhynchosporium secalis TaxID=38038 RepID=A0A1E1M9K4_RHYSE|nr:related to transcription initiation factor TFIID subunit [Rhynchosporium secalis]